MNDFFTCIGKGHGAPAVPATREDWEKMRNEKWLADMCRRIAGGNEALKSRLPIWTPGCAGFKDNHRAIADAVKPLRRLMLDFDEKGHSQEILERSMQLQQQGKWEILLVEESVRKGTHVLVTLPEGMTPQEAQTRFSNDVGFQADPALKDVARCIYMVPAENTLYVNERMFSPSPNIGKTTQPHVDAPEILRRSAPLDDRNGDAPLDDNSCQKVYPTAFKGTPYAVIIAEWFRRNGNEPQPGERNEKLHRLAAHLRYITDNNEEHLLQILPSYGLAEEEMRSLVHHACTAKFYGMPRSLKKLLAELESEKGNDGTEEMKPGEYSLSSAQPPQMPRRLPPLIRLLVSKTPPIYRPAVAHAVFPSLATHLWKVYFRYIDNVEHQATLMNLLMAGTGAGKNCIAEPINRIMADIRRRDAENLQREKEWKSEMQTKGSNKDKRKRPDGLVVQEIDPDITNINNVPDFGV